MTLTLIRTRALSPARTLPPPMTLPPPWFQGTKEEEGHLIQIYTGLWDFITHGLLVITASFLHSSTQGPYPPVVSHLEGPFSIV
nr:hypothetical protein Q903MT_gene1813 [Picea sitchensis]